MVLAKFWPIAAGSSTVSVGGTAGVIDHVHTGGLVAGGIGLDHVPVEQREHFVEAGIAVQSVLLKFEKLPSRKRMLVSLPAQGRARCRSHSDRESKHRHRCCR